jgi:hypothetical protein
MAPRERLLASRRRVWGDLSAASDYLLIVSSNRRRRHHVVPRLHLRGFATPDNRLAQIDLDTGRRRDVSISDAAVIRDFYTVVLPDGTRTDAWERWLSEVEGEIAPALRRAVEMPEFRLIDNDRERLARWIALQYLRGPSNRRQMAEIASFTIRAQVGMGGLAYLRHAMSQGLGRDIAMSEAERVWDDITSPEGPDIAVTGDEHLETLGRMYDKASAMVYGRSWGRIRFDRHRLAVSDVPVQHVRGDDYLATGWAGARAITVPLDRRTLLWLELPDGLGPDEDRDLQPTAVLARAHNHDAVLGAERFVYFHPADDPSPPQAAPRPRPRRLEVVGGLDLVNRHRPLHDVLEQIGTRTDRSADALGRGLQVADLGISAASPLALGHRSGANQCTSPTAPVRRRAWDVDDDRMRTIRFDRRSIAARRPKTPPWPAAAARREPTRRSTSPSWPSPAWGAGPPRSWPPATCSATRWPPATPLARWPPWPPTRPGRTTARRW